jgi:hypothetical protein
MAHSKAQQVQNGGRVPRFSPVFGSFLAQIRSQCFSAKVV